ncbi:hypothetical protein LTR95_007057 [Oleoguttula sp. CCFEE 5521]
MRQEHHLFYHGVLRGEVPVLYHNRASEAALALLNEPHVVRLFVVDSNRYRRIALVLRNAGMEGPNLRDERSIEASRHHVNLEHLQGGKASGQIGKELTLSSAEPNSSVRLIHVVVETWLVIPHVDDVEDEVSHYGERQHRGWIGWQPLQERNLTPLPQAKVRDPETLLSRHSQQPFATREGFDHSVQHWAIERNLVAEVDILDSSRVVGASSLDYVANDYEKHLVWEYLV